MARRAAAGETQDGEPVFSPWVRWSQRKTLTGCDRPGVYVLAHFDRKPSAVADILCRNVIYVGETCGQGGLKKRWAQFRRAAGAGGRRGHSGGVTYHRRFGPPGDTLYVAAWAPSLEDETLLPYWIRYMERRLIWHYVMKWDKPPIGNRK